MKSKTPSVYGRKIIILDFGSQVTQLIGRRLRELNVYCEIYPFNKVPALDSSVKGVILSGSPCSVRDKNAPQIDLGGIKGRFPLLGICYGAQYLAHKYGGEVLGSLAVNMAVRCWMSLTLNHLCLREFRLTHRSGCRTGTRSPVCRMARR